ncbi:MAG: hypothetical protein ACJ766_11740 [Thermoleophilaceae bacterium]|jgi:hypothetical protein
MPGPMRLLGKTTSVACALALVAALAGCGSHGQGTKEPAREGLSLSLAGVDYNVFITRELNPQIPPDNAYYKGPLAKKGEALYGVFLQACNNGKHSLPTASHFTVRDNQGKEFHPTPLPASDDFAYQPIRLDSHQCEPAAGSVAQLGPTAGSMLLFKLPLSNTYDRPLELEIKAPAEIAHPKPAKLTFTLDI